MSRLVLFLCAVFVMLAGGGQATAQVSPETKQTFFKAVEAGEVGSVKALLAEHPALIYAVRPFGETGLHVAVRHNRVEVAELLLERGADINSMRRGAEETPVVAAVTARRPEMIRVLARHGANLDAKDLHGIPLIHLATRPTGSRTNSSGNSEWVEDEDVLDTLNLLLELGADPNVTTSDQLTGESALMIAIHTQQIEKAKLLLARGADPNQASKDGRSPLAMAAELLFKATQDEFLTALRQAGAKPCVFASAAFGELDGVTAQLDQHFDQLQARGWTKKKLLTELVNIAARRGQTAMVKALLDRGAEFSVDSLGAAIESRRPEMVQLMLAHGADPNPASREYQEHPFGERWANRIHEQLRELNLAAAIRMDTIQRLVIAAGALPDTSDGNGRTKRLPFFPSDELRTREDVDQNPTQPDIRLGRLTVPPGGEIHVFRDHLYFMVTNRGGKQQIDVEFEIDDGYVSIAHSRNGGLNIEVVRLDGGEIRREKFDSLVKLEQQRNDLFVAYKKQLQRIHAQLDRLDQGPVMWRHGVCIGNKRELDERLRQTIAEEFGERSPHLFPPLYVAVIQGDADAVKRLIAEGADVNRGARFTPLHRAIWGNRANIVRLLIEAGANVNTRSRGQRWSPLHSAAVLGHTQIAKMLLDAGADRDATNLVQEKPIMLAAETGRHEIVRLLLDGAPAKDVYLFHALRRAFENGHAQTVEMLLAHGVRHVYRNDLNVTDEVRKDPALLKEHVERALAYQHFALALEVEDLPKTKHLLTIDARLASEPIQLLQNRHALSPIEIATALGNAQLVELLLDHGADPDGGGELCRNLILIAIESGNRKIFDLLLDHGVKVNATYHNGIFTGEMTALFWCVVHRRIDFGRELIRRGAETRPGDLYMAAMNDDTEFMKLLLEHGAKVDERFAGNATPLDAAAIAGSLNAIGFLLKLGADPSHVDKSGWSVIRTAAFNRRPEAVTKLLAAGVAPDVFGAILLDDVGMLKKIVSDDARQLNVVMSFHTPLTFAIQLDRRRMIEALLEAGADPKQKQGDNSPLHWACLWSNRATVQMLLDHGADFNARNRDGATPLHLVVDRADDIPDAIEMVRMLLLAGADPDARDRSGKPPYDQYDPEEIKQLFESRGRPTKPQEKK